MTPKPSLAKITDFETSFDVSPVVSPEGEVIWADVRIDYILPGGLKPKVTIRIPVLWTPYETTDQRRSKALRDARALIDHACRASGVAPQETETRSDTIGDAIESVASALDGVAQELGLAPPKTTPNANPR